MDTGRFARQGSSVLPFSLGRRALRNDKTPGVAVSAAPPLLRVESHNLRSSSIPSALSNIAIAIGESTPPRQRLADPRIVESLLGLSPAYCETYAALLALFDGQPHPEETPVLVVDARTLGRIRDFSRQSAVNHLDVLEFRGAIRLVRRGVSDGGPSGRPIRSRAQSRRMMRRRLRG